MNIIGVQTVLGRIPVERLGHCQMHEHLFVGEGPATRRNPALLIDDEECSARALRDYRTAGGVSILDAQPVGAGRNAAALHRLSRATGVHIIAVTGYHLPVFYPEDHWAMTADEGLLFERFCRELTDGCTEAPQVLPGAVKAALDGDGCRGASAVRFRAAARAAGMARVPLIVHTHLGVDAVRAVEVAAESGVPVHRVVVCHADRQAEDFAPHDAVARTGAMLEYDTIGRFKYHDDAAEARLIRHMIDDGYAGQMLLSLDTTRERLKSYGGAIGLDYLFSNFLPFLRREGISEADIHRMTHENPRKTFE